MLLFFYNKRGLVCMKRIVAYFFICFCIFYFGILNVSAKDLTLLEVINKLNNSNVYNKFKKEGASCKISATSSFLDITCDLKNEGVYSTHFELIKGTAIYHFDGNKNSSSVADESFFDVLWLVQLTDIAAINSGFNIGNKGYEKILFVYNAGSNYQQYGLKSSAFSYRYDNKTGYGISDYSVYLNYLLFFVFYHFSNLNKQQFQCYLEIYIGFYSTL